MNAFQIMRGGAQPLIHHVNGKPASIIESPSQQFRAAIYETKLRARNGKKAIAKQMRNVYRFSLRGNGITVDLTRRRDFTHHSLRITVFRRPPLASTDLFGGTEAKNSPAHMQADE